MTRNTLDGFELFKSIGTHRQVFEGAAEHRTDPLGIVFPNEGRRADDVREEHRREFSLLRHARESRRPPSRHPSRLCWNAISETTGNLALVRRTLRAGGYCGPVAPVDVIRFFIFMEPGFY